MSRIDTAFKKLAESGAKGFVPYITAGDPTAGMTVALVRMLDEVGAAVVELGVPFSDPLADGVVNQEAAQRALAGGMSLRGVLDIVREVRTSSEIPIVLFTYFNPVFKYGLEAFAADARDAGVDGVLAVDLPPEESGAYKSLMDDAGISTIYLIAPTSTEDRVRLIAEQATGFIYYVSRTGVTGVRATIDDSVRPMVETIKQHTDKPVAVGFGISSGTQAAEIAACADAVVVGSALVRIVGECAGSAETVSKVRKVAEDIMAGIKSVK
jgi:tryptophan synthase alpha chain